MGDLRKAASARRRNFPNEFALEFIPALSPDRTKWRRIPAIGVPFRLAGPFPSSARQGRPAHSCSCRFKSSISSASAVSVVTRFSILRTACSTVV
jgi:hypothetical protein